MKRLALVAALALVLTGCSAAAVSAPHESKEPAGSVAVATPDDDTQVDTSQMTVALTDQALWKTAGAPNLTAPSPASAMSTPAYNNLMRQYPNPLKSAKDNELNIVSNAICWELGAIGYAQTAAPVQSSMGLSKLQALQVITLVVSQYCPDAADKIG